MTKGDCGECLFCLSKCPKCGSMDIEVGFSTKYVFNNDRKNRIQFDRDDKEIELNCQDCGAWLSFDGYGDEDHGLIPLLQEIDAWLNFPDIIAVVIGKGKKLVREKDLYMTIKKPMDSHKGGEVNEK